MTRFSRPQIWVWLLAGAGLGAAVALYLKSQGDLNGGHKAHGEPDGEVSEVSDGSTASFVN